MWQMIDWPFIAYLISVFLCVLIYGSYFYAWLRGQKLKLCDKYFIIIVFGIFQYQIVALVTRFEKVKGIADRSWMFDTWWWSISKWALLFTIGIVALHVFNVKVRGVNGVKRECKGRDNEVYKI